MRGSECGQRTAHGIEQQVQQVCHNRHGDDGERRNGDLHAGRWYLAHRQVLHEVSVVGPLWLVALAAPAVLYGPYWAGLMSTFGLGGLLGGRLQLETSPPRSVPSRRS